MSRTARVVLILCLWAAPGLARAPQVPAGSGGTSAADYERDVALAAKLMTQRNQLFIRYSARHEIGSSALREADKPLLGEWMRLREKWHAAGRGGEFDGDIHQRSGLPVAPMPFAPAASARPLSAPAAAGGTSPADLEQRRASINAALRQLPPPAASGATLETYLGERNARLVVGGIMALVVLGAFFLVYRSIRKAMKRPAPLKAFLWHAPVVLTLWLWAGPLGYRPADRDFGLAVITNDSLAALGLTAVLYLFYRPSRRTRTRPARLRSMLWFVPGSVALWLWGARVGYYPLWDAIDLVAGRAFIGLALLGALNVLARLFRRPPAPAQGLSTVYGTAHYAPVQLLPEDAACLSKGLFLGKSTRPEWGGAPLTVPGAPVCSTPEHHTLIVARTRTGKGTRVIVPTLLRYGGSALVIDPKGENAAITARVRREHLNQNIQILNPWNELAAIYQQLGFTAATYNPLDILDRDDPNAVAIAQTLAGAICPAPASAKDKFWQGSAANILTAVFLWLADRPEEKKTLGRAREIVSLTRKEFTAKYLAQMAASDAFAGAIREMAAPFIDLADETYSGVMSNLAENTKFLSDPQIKAATAESSFAMQDLAARKTTVYVVIPTERMDTQRTWLRLVIAAAMHVFKNPQARRQFGHRCLFLIDEFAALGRLDDLPRDIATMSGFGVDFALIVQGLDQLKDHYGEARGTILSNCAYKWFCNVADLDSAKYLSDTLGKATVQTVSSSNSVSRSPQSSSSGQSVTYAETGRLLLNPDEVLNLGKDVAIAIQPNGHPHYLKPIDYWNMHEAFAALQQACPGLYWDPPLLYDVNPYAGPSQTPPGSWLLQQGKNGVQIMVPQGMEEEVRKLLSMGRAA